MHLRKHLLGAVLTEVRAISGGLAIGWRGAQGSLWLVCRANQLTWCAPNPRQAWPGRLDRELEARITAAQPAPPSEPRPAVTALEQRLAEERGPGAHDSDQLRHARQRLRRQLKRVRRLVSALEGDLARADQAEALRYGGEVLKTQLSAVPRGASVVELEVPWAPGERVTVALRPELSPTDNLNRIFRRARGFDKHRGLIEERLLAAWAERDRLLALRTRLDTHTEETLAALGEQPAARARKQQLASRDLPAGVQRWLTADGGEVLLGRNAKANDLIVTRFARGRDLWMHLRDRPGSHLLLRWGREQPPGVELLLSCATLCAWASGVKVDDRADVMWAFAKYVRKSKGAGPGKVYVSNDRNLFVEVRADEVEGWKSRRRGD